MSGDPTDAPARYVFRVTVRLTPGEGLAVEPDRFETVLYRTANPPGEDGWLFFRDNLWRGNLADEAHFRRQATDALGVPVESASFSELQTTEAYLDALQAAIAADLDAFNAENVTEVLSKYLGSSIRVE
ncbi:LWR-salt protein [Haloarcula sp. JP-L23]|uniref:LWR-salt protein n=1 Tax=Haloarcula sp. JP-L23 TaxID=2716717 RepID=UPI00140EF252|nr:LWR-salt protein [Haloarcula sp. JP-L23]